MPAVERISMSMEQGLCRKLDQLVQEEWPQDEALLARRP